MEYDEYEQPNALMVAKSLLRLEMVRQFRQGMEHDQYEQPTPLMVGESRLRPGMLRQFR